VDAEDPLANEVPKELIEDRHPVIPVPGGDIARLLISREIEGKALKRWLEHFVSDAPLTGPGRTPREG
jgi:hypothetical protein